MAAAGKIAELPVTAKPTLTVELVGRYLAFPLGKAFEEPCETDAKAWAPSRVMVYAMVVNPVAVSPPFWEYAAAVKLVFVLIARAIEPLEEAKAPFTSVTFKVILDEPAVPVVAPVGANALTKALGLAPVTTIFGLTVELRLML